MNIRAASALFAVALAVVWTVDAGECRASETILPGFSLYTTQPGSSFGGIEFTGAPLGTFDFGAGAVDVGTTDTIMRRLSQGSAPSADIPIELVALHLQSIPPADFGCGLGTYFLTLQSERGGPATTGTMSIDIGPEPSFGDPHGIYSEAFDLFFDVRFGALDGPICLSDQFTVTSSGNPWTHIPKYGTVLIDGVNNLLDGADRSKDFHNFADVQLLFPNRTFINGKETLQLVPEPSSLALVAAGAFGLLTVRVRRRLRPLIR